MKRRKEHIRQSVQALVLVAMFISAVCLFTFGAVAMYLGAVDEARGILKACVIDSALAALLTYAWW